MGHCVFGLAKKNPNRFWWLLAAASSGSHCPLTTSPEVSPAREELAGDNILLSSCKEVPLPPNVTGSLL